MIKYYDYIVIGGGSGGIVLINCVVMYGQKCVFIEVKELGGICVNVGCVLKKVMWYVVQICEVIYLYGLDYGFDIMINQFDWSKLIVSCIVYIDCIYILYDNVLGKNNVDVIKGFVCFVDVKIIEVNGEIIIVDYILIVIGGCLSYFEISGVEYGIDFDGFFVLFVLLECVVVVGVGYIVVELVGVINVLGVKMYLFVCKYVLLCSFDLMISEMLVEVMNVEGL